MASRCSRLLLLWIVPALLVAGCAARDIEDFSKQEFVAADKPLIHLALRGGRRDRQLVCQVYLLTTNKSLWISGVELRLGDGSILDPKSVESLQEEECYPPPRLGYCTGFGYYPVYRSWGAPYYRRYWRRGTFAPYRTDAGVYVPSWYLLGHANGPDTPSGIEYTFEIPEGRTTCEGVALIVSIVASPETASAAKGKRSMKSATDAEKELRLPLTFALTEKPTPPDAADRRKDPKTILHEIEFAQEKPKPAE